VLTSVRGMVNVGRPTYGPDAQNDLSERTGVCAILRGTRHGIHTGYQEDPE
jgi:hypothetical protein